MKIISEKREVVGTLKTLVGNYSLLDEQHFQLFNGLYRFRVVDDENFDNWVQFIGDFIIIPAKVPTMKEVKRVITEEEATQYSELLKQLQEVE